MSQKLVSRSPDLSCLLADGYDIEVRPSGPLLLKGVPYVNSRKEVRYGILASELDVAGETTSTPKTHVAYFIGDYPCDVDGSALPGVTPNANKALDKDITLNHSLSRKPTIGSYQNYHEKMTTYVAIISSPAHAIDPTVKAKSFPTVVPADGESVFNYLDTAATKAGIVVANSKLESQRVGIVGVGGTGSYVLDLVAKTVVAEIHLFDRDVFLNHSAFRAPGAASLGELTKKPLKVSYLKDLYSKMRKGIFAHECFVDETTVEQLWNLTFVFLCIDKGKPKQLIVEHLEQWGIPFVDAGMGVQLVDNALMGILTVTTSTEKKRDHLRNRVAFGDGEGDNEYSRNVQIADLNALNAALAVIKWKKLCGYYHDLAHEHFTAYTISRNQLLNEDKHDA
jgi:hypothetical protein